MSNIGIIDIESYKDCFVFVGDTYDEDTKELLEHCSVMSRNFITSEDWKKVESYLNRTDYLVSFNGSKFDLPALAKLQKDILNTCPFPTQFFFSDTQNLISFDSTRNKIARRLPSNKIWSMKHFDLLNCCLLNKSLKQWEMYEFLDIRELPYAPNTTGLTDEQCKEIQTYCEYDVKATAEIFWKHGYDKCVIIGRPPFKAYQYLYSRLPEHLKYRFDRPTASLASALLYHQNNPIPPKTTDPFQLFDIHSFDVPIDLKITIAAIARGDDKIEKAWNGITYGKGGAHFIVPGKHEDLYEFDVASMYPNIVCHWKLLKTPEAIQRYAETMKERLEAKKDLMGHRNQGLKLIITAFTGSMRLKSGFNVSYDNAAGEALCYIGQLIITELALAAPENTLVEINTDSVFVKGNVAAECLRVRAKEIEKKYGIQMATGKPVIEFEEEHVELSYFRDVNNYVLYDSNKKIIKGKGDDYADLSRKKSNRAVYYELFRNVINTTLDIDWKKYDWKDFIYKYHKSAASKYANIGDKPMDRKNYYMLWTTRECPNSASINFSRDLVNSKNGSIKARWGVYGFSVEDLEQYIPYIDHKQYHMDLDDALELWGRKDLCTTRLLTGKYGTKKKMNTCLSLQDLVPGVY